MTLTIKREIEEVIEVEGEFPVYMYYSHCHYKFIDQNTFYEVHQYESGNYKILKTGHSDNAMWAAEVFLKGEPSYEVDFNTAFEAAIEKLRSEIYSQLKQAV